MLSWRFTVKQQCFLAPPSNCSLPGLYLFLCCMASVSLAAKLGSGNTSIPLKITFTVHLSLFSLDWNCPHLNLLGWAILLSVCICLVTPLLFQLSSTTPHPRGTDSSRPLHSRAVLDKYEHSWVPWPLTDDRADWTTQTHQPPHQNWQYRKIEKRNSILRCKPNTLIFLS